MSRDALKDAARIVVKLGTGVLTNEHKLLERAHVERVVDQVGALRSLGKEVVLVTSGAVGAGMGALGFQKRPGTLAELQACAAVGQSRLMSVYQQLFDKWGLPVAQVLLTHEDLAHHERHLNARNTLVALLDRGVIPIINENDAVSFTELKFGDNDRLSALVACLLPADLLVILTTVDGLVENFGTPQARLVPVVTEVDGAVEREASGTTSATAVGGMTSKLQAAKITMRAGIPLVIASGRKSKALVDILAGKEEGTLFVPKAGKLKGRKRWIAFFHHPKGTLTVDDGAKRALREAGRSLLAPGIKRCEGAFAKGDVVRICDLDGTEFARGLARFDAKALTGNALVKEVVVHRDDLVVL
jgi:glutamate 5-kinase